MEKEKYNPPIMDLIIAGPGAGKTASLVSRIEDLLHNGVSSYLIRPFTFSREAAIEISQRLGGDIAVQTNHSFALSVIKLARSTRGEAIPRIVTDDKQEELFQRAITETDSNIDVKKLKDLLDKCRQNGIQLTALEPAVQRAAQQYFRILHAENMVDFTSLLEVANQELTSDMVRDLFAGLHILVDEGQDTNPHNEWPIIEKLYRYSEGLSIFASPSQQIYGFRGADWDVLVNRFPEYREEFILENHRSTPEIVQASIDLAGEDARNMIPVNDSIGVPVIHVDTTDPETECGFIASQVSKWLTQGIIENPSEIAILSRIHSSNIPIARALRTFRIPIEVMAHKKNPFHKIETRAFLGYLRLAANPMADEMLEDIIDYPSHGIGVRRRFQLRGDAILNWDHLIDALGNKEEIPDQVRRRIFQILTIREQLIQLRKTEKDIQTIVSKTIDISGILSQIQADNDYNGTKAINEFINASREFSSLNEFVGYLEGELQTPREREGVKLGTLHGSKGREWRGVILPNWNDGILPLRGGNEREEKNLAFVGVSRAKERLVLTSSFQYPISPFVGMIQEVHKSQWPSKTISQI